MAKEFLEEEEIFLDGGGGEVLFSYKEARKYN
jgi:hypothetical protein